MANPNTVIKTRSPLPSQNLIGSIAAISSSTTALFFSLGDQSQAYRGQLTIVGSGGAVTTPTWVLECSADGGTSWFVIPANTTNAATVSGTLSGETASIFVNQYNVSGLGSALYKFGASAGTGWAAVNIYAFVG